MVLVKFIDRLLGRFGGASPSKNVASRGSVQPDAMGEQRLCPRRKYNEEAAPLLHIGQHVFKVIDLSKTGVRFLLHRPDLVKGDTLEGTIRVDGACIHFRGAPVRSDGDAGIMAVQFMQTEYLLD